MTRRRVAWLAVAAAAFLLSLLVSGPLGADEYRVRRGDTLSEVAERFGVSVRQLVEANGIVDPDLIYAGEVLVIPGSADSRGPVTVPAAGGGTYVVRAGDTLSEIAERVGVPAGAIAAVNGLTDPNFVLEGQTLVIPLVESPLLPPVSPELESLMEHFAREEGVDPGLVKAIAYLESGWEQDAVSPSGAVGVMQIHPSTGHWLEREVFGYDLNIETSAYDNIRAGTRYLRILLDLTGDPDQAVAAYYQGYGSLSRGVLYEETIEYVASVNAIRDRFWS